MTDPFQYCQETLYCEETPVDAIARKAGTPCYVYSSAAIVEAFRAYDAALGAAPHQICYAVKANSNLAVLALLAKAGAGFDIVSGGELFRVLKAGGDASKVVFSGVGKTAAEVEYALAQGIHSFNCESEAEMVLIDSLAARRGVNARVAIRVNPDVNAETHPYISTGLRKHKFGIDITGVEAVYERAQSLRHVTADGVSCHVGSQILETEPFLEALDKLIALAERLRAKGIPVRFVDLGGGLGIPYKPGEHAPDLASFGAEILRRVAGKDLCVMLEPGRSIVGAAGALLTRVLYRKTNGSKEFVVVDAAMNDLIRPSLYRSHHEVLPSRKSPRGTIVADVVGPICETGDFLAKDREIANVLPGDLLAVTTAGAYGFVAASNYNSRPRVAEVLVDGGEWRVIRKRETFEDLIRGETV